MFPPMARAPRLLLSLLLCASPSLLVGCKTGPQLTKVEAPAEGIALRYDLTPGQVYKGSVRHNETIRSANTSNSSSNHFSFDLTLVVRGPDAEHGGNHVTARFSAVTVRWTPPPGLPISVAELNKKASAQLQGLEVDFSVDETGKIVHMPELPDDFPKESRPIVQEALDMLETAFLSVPAQALKQGDTWKDEKKRGRQGKLGRYVQGTVQTKIDGFYKTGEPPVTVAKLVTEEEETEITTTSSGGHEVKKRGSTSALFATDQKYLVNYTADRQYDDTGNTNSFVKTEVSWQKVPSQTTPAAASTTQVQDISDPCHPDYVGAEECVEQPAAPASEPAPAAAPAAPAPAPAK